MMIQIHNELRYLNDLKKIKCFVLDMDGTFYLGNKIIDGSLQFIDAIKSKVKSFMFLTNNSSHDGEYYIEKLSRMGCNITRDQIFTSGGATAIYLNREKKGQKIYVLGNQYLKKELIENGILVTEENPDLVVVGFDTTLTYEKMAKTCHFIRNGIPFIATHPDFNCPTEQGMIPDCGAILAFIKASTGRDPYTVIGKPNAEIVNSLIHKTGLMPGEMAIVGDRLYTDIATGVNHGILSILVLSGETTMEDVENSCVKPHLVFDCLKDIALKL